MIPVIPRLYGIETRLWQCTVGNEARRFLELFLAKAHTGFQFCRGSILQFDGVNLRLNHNKQAWNGADSAGVIVTDLMEPVAIWGHWIAVALLVAVIIYDLRFMRLPNLLVLLFVLVFALTVAWTLPLNDLAWRVGVALAILLVGAAANVAKLLGGGDVKTLAALILFVPRESLLSFAFLFCICMIVGIMGLLALRRVLRTKNPIWRGLQENGRYPMGISIGMAGLIMVFFRLGG